MKTTSLIIFSILLLTSCKSLKMVKLMTKGEIEQQQFISEIPFECGMGLIIIKVTIEGKEYDFLCDTGAPNVISTELAQELNIKPYVLNKTVDSQGKKEELEYLLLPSVRIGSVDFLNTGAAVADLNRSSVIACLNIDGIIGANLMQKAIWQLDYDKSSLSTCPVTVKLGLGLRHHGDLDVAEGLYGDKALNTSNPLVKKGPIIIDRITYYFE